MTTKTKIATIETNRLKKVIGVARSRRAADDLRAVLLTPSGRRLLWGIMKSTGMHAEPPGHPHGLAVQAGGRIVGLALRASIMEVNFNDATILAAMETEYESLPDIDPRTLQGVGDEDDPEYGEEQSEYLDDDEE